MLSALTDIDVVFHEAAYGGYMPEMAKYVLVNSFGTAQMLEIIRDHKLPVRKVVVASSQAVYSEGAAECPEHGHVVPLLRPAEATPLRRLQRTLPGLQQSDNLCSHARVHTRGRRDGLCAYQGRSGAPRAAVGQADGHADRGAALLLHVWPAPVAL